MVRDAKTNKILEIILYCLNCKDWTLHKLEDEFVACSCGEAVQVNERGDNE